MKISPFDPRVDGNRVYGRGSCDMKGGLAAVMSAAAAIAAQGSIHGIVILALVCDEEYASIGADDYVRRHKADACILTEPSDLKLVMAHKGFVWGEVLTSGKSAHGSRWDLGVSAITKMGKVIVCLDEFDRNVLRQRTEDLVGPASMHVSIIRGGVGVSTYAQECRIHLERRTLPSENMDEVKRELERVILNTDERAQVNWYFSRPPFSCDRNEPIVHHVIRAAKAVTGLEPEKVGWGVWTDAAVFKSVGIPTVNIGPSGFGLHEPVEWVDFESVVSTAEILIDTANSFCSK